MNRRAADLAAALGVLPGLDTAGGQPVGGLVTSFALELLVYPALFAIWKQRTPPGG